MINLLARTSTCDVPSPMLLMYSPAVDAPPPLVTEAESAMVLDAPFSEVLAAMRSKPLALKLPTLDVRVVSEFAVAVDCVAVACRAVTVVDIEPPKAAVRVVISAALAVFSLPDTTNVELIVAMLLLTDEKPAGVDAERFVMSVTAASTAFAKTVTVSSNDATVEATCAIS
jgi:hypothetical protein